MNKQLFKFITLTLALAIPATRISANEHVKQESGRLSRLKSSLAATWQDKRVKVVTIVAAIGLGSFIAGRGSSNKVTRSLFNESDSGKRYTYYIGTNIATPKTAWERAPWLKRLYWHLCDTYGK